MRCVFFGTPELAVATLAALSGIAEVAFAVCQPDRPAGRGLQSRPPPIKTWALQNDIEILQPLKLKDGDLARRVRDAGVDLGVVLAYGRLLPQDLLDAPRLGCVNLHASLLPRHRGAAPIAWSIMSGDLETGVSLMQMDAGLDTGPILAQHGLSIHPRETTGSLTNRIAELCAEVTRLEIPRLVNGELTPSAQDSQQATWAPPIRAADRSLDFSLPAIKLDARVRALSPAPAALTTCRGRILRVLETLPLAEKLDAEPGTIQVTGNKEISISTGAGCLRLVRAQFEGKKALNAADLLNGRSIASGDRLGN